MFAHGSLGGGDVFRGFDDGGAGFGVVRDADERAGPGVGADGLDAEAVGEDGVVRDLGEIFAAELETGCMDADAVAEVDEARELVERHEVVDAVREMLDGVGGVVGEGLGGCAVLPASLILKRLREIPMVERAVGGDAGIEQGVDQLVVEVEAFGVRRAG